MEQHFWATVSHEFGQQTLGFLGCEKLLNVIKSLLLIFALISLVRYGLIWCLYGHNMVL